MAYGFSNRKPTFIWQALLIVLPVALLATVGFLSLRQDKLLAEHEAAQRAQAIADDLLPKIQADLVPASESALSEITFLVAPNGDLLFPPPAKPVPEPHPFDLSQLDARQTQLWRESQQVSAGPNGDRVAALKSAIKACRDLSNWQPPKPFAAAACYSKGLWWAELGESQMAADAFNELFERYPDAVGESGLPLEPLAALKLLEVRNSSTTPLREKLDRGDNFKSIFLEFPLSVDSLCASVVRYPTPLSPYLLAAALRTARTAQEQSDCRKWQAVWEQDDAARQLYSAARSNLVNRAFGLLDAPSSSEQPGSAPLLSGSETASPQLFWVTLPYPWRNFVTNITSVDTNGVPVRSGIEVEEQNWLLARYAGVARGIPNRLNRQRLEPLTQLRFGTDPARRLLKNVVTQPVLGEPSASSDQGYWVSCRPEYEVGSRLAARIAATPSIPDFFGIGIEIAGRRLTHLAPDLRTWQRVGYAGKGGGVRKEFSQQLATNVLASASGPSETGRLKINVYLTSASTLFERQATRSFWFGSLIGVAGLAALAGLGSAWRAFHRQQALSEMKSNFVSSVSHELRAPIASVRLLAESLELGKIQEPARQQEYFRFIVQECRRLSGLIENVLDFSRIDQGRKQYEFEPTDLPALIRQTAAVIEPYATDHGVRVLLSLPDPAAISPEFQAIVDGKAIQQALINLLDNAIKHSPRDAQVTIGLELVPGDVAGSSDPSGARGVEPGLEANALRLWVEDHGDGIAADEHEKIFERFYRCGSELRRETPGVGIGLSIVEHIVEAHRGRIVVRSAPGQGSRFTIELPADPGFLPPSKRAGQPGSPGTPPSAPKPDP
jgi:signal transduction histidine kinase